MLTADRHRRLLRWLDETGSLRTSDVADHLGVSVDTVRRDLEELERGGALVRVRGGAVPGRTTPASFRERRSDDGDGRAALATAVVDRIRPGMAIGLDAGSTSIEIARRLPRDHDLTIVTNGPAALVELLDRTDVVAVAIGGRIDTRWLAAVGGEAERAIAEHRLDLAVVGCCGLTSSTVATDSLDEVGTKRAWMHAAARTLVTAEADKLGLSARHTIGHPADVDEVLTTATTDDDQAAAVRAVADHTAVTVVPPHSPTGPPQGATP